MGVGGREGKMGNAYRWADSKLRDGPAIGKTRQPTLFDHMVNEHFVNYKTHAVLSPEQRQAAHTQLHQSKASHLHKSLARLLKAAAARRRTPNPHVRQGAQDYNAKVGLGSLVENHYVPVDENQSRRIADAYDAMPSDDSLNPDVRRAYGALGNEINSQWDHAVNHMGMRFEPWKSEGQPYADSDEMTRDVADNKHLYFFTGGEPHPLLKQTDPQTGLSLNDKFRAIHDFFGHSAEGYGFGPRGEENAWLKHSQMFSPEAQKAMSTETRGQNSWTNFGRHNYHPDGSYKNIHPTERPFADQKVALLPDEHLDWRGVMQSRMKQPALTRSERAFDAVHPLIKSHMMPVYTTSYAFWKAQFRKSVPDVRPQLPQRQVVGIKRRLAKGR